MKPRVVSGLRPYRLYKAETAAAIFRETGKTQAIAFAVVALVLAGKVFGAHVEVPFLASFAGPATTRSTCPSVSTRRTSTGLPGSSA
jgi:hypothetical protein